jgi:hypothetical protein
LSIVNEIDKEGQLERFKIDFNSFSNFYASGV